MSGSSALSSRRGARSDPQQTKEWCARTMCAAARSCGASTPIPRGAGRIGNEDLGETYWVANGNTGVWAHLTGDEDSASLRYPWKRRHRDTLRWTPDPGRNLFDRVLVAVDLKTARASGNSSSSNHPMELGHDIGAEYGDIPSNGPSRQGGIGRLPSRAGSTVFDRSDRPAGLCRSRSGRLAAVGRARRKEVRPPGVPARRLQYARNYSSATNHDLPAGTAAAGARFLQGATRWCPSRSLRAGSATPNGIPRAIRSGTDTTAVGFGTTPTPTPLHAIGDNTPGCARMAVQPGEYSGYPIHQGSPDRNSASCWDTALRCAAGAPQKAERARQARNRRGHASPPQALRRLTQGCRSRKRLRDLLALIDLDQGAGEVAGAHGGTPTRCRNHPAIKARHPKTGQAQTRGAGGLAITK